MSSVNLKKKITKICNVFLNWNKKDLSLMLKSLKIAKNKESQFEDMSNKFKPFL